MYYPNVIFLFIYFYFMFPKQFYYWGLLRDLHGLCADAGLVTRESAQPMLYFPEKANMTLQYEIITVHNFVNTKYNLMYKPH